MSANAKRRGAGASNSGGGKKGSSAAANNQNNHHQQFGSHVQPYYTIPSASGSNARNSLKGGGGQVRRHGMEAYIQQQEAQYERTVIFATIGLSCGVLAIFAFIYDKQPTPYMDEEFHVNQAQAYCKGNFSYWNKKITTPPGLYLTTLGVLKPFSELYAFGEEDETKICPLIMLRLTNLFFSAANLYIIYLIGCMQHDYIPKPNRVLLLANACSISLCPPLFFFNFLYYTDVGSLFFVLLVVLFNGNRYHWLASLFAAISLLYRQTNIVWALFVASYGCLRLFKLHLDRRRKNVSTPQFLFDALLECTARFGGFVFVGLIFMTFLAYNKGIVLGDKSAHQATFHLAQIGYYYGFLAALALPWLISVGNVKRFSASLINRPLAYLAASALLAVSILKFSSPHPYLLADNRHITFYVWRRILSHPLYRWATIPVSLYAGWASWNLPAASTNQLSPSYCPAASFYSGATSLSSSSASPSSNGTTNGVHSQGYISHKHDNKPGSMARQDIFWKVSITACTFLTLVPQGLLEVRYFVTPFILWRLSLPPTRPATLLFELLYYILLNGVMLYLFAYKTFSWTQQPGTLQRIMW